MGDAILAALDDIHAALVSGSFDRLEDHLLALDSASGRLSALSETEAEMIRAKSLRNEKCLIAALDGIQAARIRIREIRRAAAGLSTYDKAGSVSLILGMTAPVRRV